MTNSKTRTGIATLVIGLSVLGSYSTSSAQDSSDIDDLQGTVEALSTEIAEIQYDSIPDVDEIDQDAFDALADEIKVGRPVFGPEDGEIVHDPEFIRLWYATGTFDDFLMEATFGNPHDEEEGAFDFGAELRIHGDYLNPVRVYLIIDSDGNWLASVGTDDEWAAEDEVALGDGKFRGIDGTARGENTLTVILVGQTLHFAVNGDYVSSVGLPSDAGGYLAIGTGFFDGNTVNGESTPFLDFSVWES